MLALDSALKSIIYPSFAKEESIQSQPGAPHMCMLCSLSSSAALLLGLGYHINTCQQSA